MAMFTERVFPTRYPLIDFYLRIWKLNIATGIMSESMESMTYQYIMLFISWGEKRIFNFRLYETYRRAIERKNVH